MEVPTERQLAQNYWLSVLIRGIFAILFGAALLIWPHISLLIFIILFGIFALLDGVIAIGAAFMRRQVLPYWWLLLLGGIVGVLVGVITFLWPGLTALILLYIVAFWAIFTGIAAIVVGFMPGASLSVEWPVVLTGVLAVIVGLFLLFRPFGGILSIIWLIGIYLIIHGISLIVRAFQFRSGAAQLSS